MHLTDDIKDAISRNHPNHRRATPVFFRRIRISLKNINHGNRQKLEYSCTFNNIKEALNNPPNNLPAKISHFSYTAFSLTTTARCSSKQKLTLKKATRLKAAINTATEKEDSSSNKPYS